MSIKQRLDLAMAAIGLKSLPHPVNPRAGDELGSSDPRWWPLALPGSSIDWSGVANRLDQNGTVSVCLAWYESQWTQAKLLGYTIDGDGDAVETDLPLVRRLARPNPWMTGEMLWYDLIAGLRIDGNAYWHIIGSMDNPTEIWPRRLTPVPDRTGESWISHYDYRANGQTYRVDPSEVVHFRIGRDLREPRLGLSPLKRMLREVATDNEASTYTHALLANSGVPSVVISPPPGQRINDADVPTMRARFKSATGGDRRGDVLINPSSASIEKIGYSPGEMSLGEIWSIPERRIIAAMALNPQVLGMPSDEGSKTYSNYAESRKAAWQDGLQPMQRLVASVINARMLNPDALAQSANVEWDYDRVEALQEDRDAVHARARANWRENLLTRGEARQMIGYTPVDVRDDVFYHEMTMPDLSNPDAFAGSFDRDADDEGESADEDDQEGDE